MKGDNSLNTLETIAKRRSHHEFKDTKLSKDQLELLIKCGLGKINKEEIKECGFMKKDYKCQWTLKSAT